GFAHGDGEAFRSRHGVPADAPLLLLLPGSRTGEVSRLLPVFGDTVARLMAQFPGLRVAIPAVDHLRERIRADTRSWPIAVAVVGAEEKHDAFAAATCALAASGTVTLELAMAGVAHAIAYRVNALTGVIGKWLIKTPFANLLNIVLGREAIPEYIQDDCTPDNLARELARLLGDAGARLRQLEGAREALAHFEPDGVAPGERAADVGLSVMKKGKMP
ncbi:MAG: lipid-A-disaccharide synthase, partial [Alphaproteobacteria bacterium]|nr:lipid-A-disaccharide synthase [Alphaproteobacteria bacterium]